jgi:glycosyltransferase involved in cell wall biosynthesis
VELEKTRILMNDHSGHPFTIQLSRELASRGYEVLHTYSKSFQTPKGPLLKRENDPENFQIKGIELSEPFQKYSFIKRRSQEREFGHILSSDIRTFKPDVLISSNTPLDAQSVILKTVQSENIRFIFWVQDIYNIAMTKILTEKLSLFGTLVGRYYKMMERKQLQISNAVVMITEDFIPLVKSWSIDDSKCYVIPNWAPINELPIYAKENKWSIKNKLNDKFCIMYSGTLGMKHDPDILLKIAQFYKDNDNIKVVVISEGLGADWLKSKKVEFNLDNLMITDFQPFEDLPYVLSSADIFVAVLEPYAGIFSVPSKVLTYLCFKRPLILAVPEENLSARIVKKIKAGEVINPRDIDMIIEKLDGLVNNHSLREVLGNNALRYAEKYFDINVITNSFEKIIHNII